MLGLQSRWSKTLRALKIASGKVVWTNTIFRGITPVRIVLFLHYGQADSGQAHNALEVNQQYFSS